MDEGEQKRKGIGVPTELQARMLNALAQSPNSSCSTACLATRIGSNRVAIAAAGRALERAKLIVHGAMYEKGEDFKSHVVVDGNIITGQNPASAKDAAIHTLAMARAQVKKSIAY